jgi:hypothetical protein
MTSLITNQNGYCEKSLQKLGPYRTGPVYCENIVTVLVLNIIVVTTLVGNGRHYAMQSQRYVRAIKQVKNSDYTYNDVTEWNLVDTSQYTLSKIVNAIDTVNASTSVSALWLLILLL